MCVYAHIYIYIHTHMYIYVTEESFSNLEYGLIETAQK